MQDIYLDGLKLLFKYREFHVLYSTLRYGLLIIILLLLFIALLHIIFMLGFNSPLYRKKSPARGWNRRFAPALILLLGLTGGFYWLLGYVEQLVF